MAAKSRPPFEELYQQLEEKVGRLEQGGLSLDDSLTTYEEAVGLAQRCQQLLDRAELRITRLKESIHGGESYGEDEAVEDEEGEGGVKLRADFHSHSNYSRDSVIGPQAFIDRCVRKGVNCIAVTDHNEIEGAFVIEKLAPFKVIIGEEVKTSEGEIIGLFLKELVPRDLSPEETIGAIHEQGGLAVIPHPYDIFRRSVLKPDALERVKEQVDAIEGFNCRNILSRHDERARELARGVGKPFTLGTDAHSPWELGGASLELEAFETPAELLQTLPEGRIVGGRSLPMVHWISTYAKIRWRLGLRPAYASPPRAPARR